MKSAVTLFALLLTLSVYGVKHTVEVGPGGNLIYSPSTLVIDLGDTVLFQWKTGDHPTASDNGTFPTFSMNTAQQTHELVLTSVDTFWYHCTNHGSPQSGMHGRIIVNAAPTGTADAFDVAKNIYPNPALSQVNTVIQPGARVIQVLDIMGRVIVDKAVSGQIGGSEIIDISMLDSGHYMVIQLDANGMLLKRDQLIKQE